MRWLLAVAVGAAAALSAVIVVSLASGAPVAGCPVGAVRAVIGERLMCLKVEGKCATRFDVQYSRHGFTCTAGRLTSRSRWAITVLPGDSLALAINDHGQIVGYSRGLASAGYGHAFLWEKGTMRDLGTLGGVTSEATAINEQGQVVGDSATATGETHAFLWRNGALTDLGIPGLYSKAVAVNERGQIVGYGTTAPGGPAYGFLWENGVMTDLGNFFPVAINEAGQIVGRISAGDGSRSGDNDRSALWQAGKLTDVGGPGTLAAAINQRGQITGSSRTATYEHTFVWRDGVMRQLGTLGGIVSRARGINNRGEAVGSSLTTTGRQHAALWAGGGITDLGTLSPNLGYSSAVAINDQGQVIGRSYSGGRYGRRAFVWQNGKMRDLGSLGGLITDVHAINARGDIIGQSTTPTNQGYAVLWTLRRST